MEQLGRAERENSGENAADNIVLGQNAPDAGIRTGHAVIAEHKIFAAAQSYRLGTAKGLQARRQIRLAKRQAFRMLFIGYYHTALRQLNRFTWQADDPLNKK